MYPIKISIAIPTYKDSNRDFIKDFNKVYQSMSHYLNSLFIIYSFLEGLNMYSIKIW